MQKAEKSSTYISQKTVTFFAVSAKMGLLLLDKSAIIPSESGKSFVWDNLSTFLKKKDGVGSVAGQRPLLFGCKFRVFMLLLCDNGVTILLRCVFL